MSDINEIEKYFDILLKKNSEYKSDSPLASDARRLKSSFWILRSICKELAAVWAMIMPIMLRLLNKWPVAFINFQMLAMKRWTIAYAQWL